MSRLLLVEDSLVISGHQWSSVVIRGHQMTRLLLVEDSLVRELCDEGQHASLWARGRGAPC